MLKVLRNFSLLALGLLSAGALTRCAPIAASVSKHSLFSSSVGSHSVANQVGAIESQSSLSIEFEVLPEHGDSLTGVQTPGFEKDLPSGRMAIHLGIASELDKEFGEFKKQGTTHLSVEIKPGCTARAVLRVDLKKGEIKSLDLSAIHMKLGSAGENTWMLSLEGAAQDPARQAILDHLQQVSISVGAQTPSEQDTLDDEVE